MTDCVRELCLLSILSGAALSLMPEGGTKRLLRVVSTAALLALILNAAHRLDLSAYPLDFARWREREQELSAQADETRDALSRLVIEGEYAAYIQDKAAQLGVKVTEVRIATHWAEGVWVPESAVIRGVDAKDRAALASLLLSELGIPYERQEWPDDG